MSPTDIRALACVMQACAKYKQDDEVCEALLALADLVQSLQRWPHPADCSCARCAAMARVEAIPP